ncbi:A-kinase anchor protein 17B [Bienertia sinuspersici]
MSNNPKPFESIPPTKQVQLTNDLTLIPRIKFTLTIYRADASVSPLDEWKLKKSLINFLKSSFSHPISIPEDDLIIRRFKDLKKRKREDPVAIVTLFIRDLGFVEKIRGFEDEDGVLEKKFLEWRKVLLEKMDGIEINLEGVRFRVSATLPISDDFQSMMKEWQEFYAFGPGSYSRGSKKEPDTIILRSLPSRWFAEPRVSSKPSMLVTHTIFSAFGKIRNLNVAEDDDLGKDADDEDMISGLQCRIFIQFEQYKDFSSALKVLCSRSLQKEGSRMKADYEVSWDKDGFFESGKHHTQERINQFGPGQYRNEGTRHSSYSSRTRSRSRYSPEDVHSKRFRG